MRKHRVCTCVFFAILAITAGSLCACTGEDLLSNPLSDPLPQKVTIEKREESAAGGTSAETAPAASSATPTPSAGNTSGQNAQSDTNQAPALYAIDATDADDVTLSASARKLVVEAANHRLDTGYYTKQSMIDGLLSDGFSQEEAEYGATHCYAELP